MEKALSTWSRRVCCCDAAYLPCKGRLSNDCQPRIVGVRADVLVAALYFRVHELDRRQDIQDAEGEKDLLTIAADPMQQRAEKLFKLHQLELKKYYDQTLKHSIRIFAVGIVCLLLGFVIIGVTIYLFIFSQLLLGSR